ncbi:MAG: hypothetical protein ACE5EG_05065 [Thermoanaerobaculia bacterium]
MSRTALLCGGSLLYGLGTASLTYWSPDALLFLMAGDFLSLAFHGWVFIAVGSGFLACRKLAALDAPPVEQVLSPA